MSSLQTGWAYCELRDCAEVLDGQRVPVNSKERADRQGPVPYYGATGQVGWIDNHLFDEELVLLGEDGAPFLDKSRPIAYLVNGKCWVNNHAHVLRALTGLTSNKYLKYCLDNSDFRDFVNGTTRLKLTQSAMNRLPIPLPPFAEQNRMVVKLEALLMRVDSCQKRLVQIPTLLKRFRQSVLAAACSGRLTEDWRELREIDSDWPTVPLSDLFEMKNGKSLTAPNRTEGDFPVYGGNGLIGRHSRCNAEGQVIVIGRVGAQCGNVHYVSGKVWVTDNAISLQPRRKVVTTYFALFLSAKRVNQLSAGTGQPYISQEILSAIDTPVPSLVEQREIVQRVEALLALADQIEARCNKAQAYVDKLTPSLLAKAFRGELVPQDPNDEPAEKLLERIRAARAPHDSGGIKRKPHAPKVGKTHTKRKATRL